MNKHDIIYVLITLAALTLAILLFTAGIHVGLSISADDYDGEVVPTLSMLASWFAALGTLSAVAVSLWLAFRQIAQDREILDCYLSTNIIPTHQDEPVIGLRIISKGNKPANIVSVSWLASDAQAAMWVSTFHELSERLPKTLSYGQQINLLHVVGFESHLKQYVNEHLNGKFEKLHMLVSTTTDTFKVVPTSALRKYIANAADC